MTDIVLREGYLSKDRLDVVMRPENMVGKAFVNAAELGGAKDEADDAVAPLSQGNRARSKSRTTRMRRMSSIMVDLQSGSSYGTGPTLRTATQVPPPIAE